MKRPHIGLILAILGINPAGAQLSSVATFPAGTPSDTINRRAGFIVPTPRQVSWQELEFTFFIHFGINTFTGREWGDGNEDPSLFAPTAFDGRQWVRTAKMAGARLLLMVAKHHDGFCLWPSDLTDHSVKRSPWRRGKGDVIAEVAAACRKEGMKLGLYLSPWDRASPLYGTDAYNDYFVGQLRELLTRYGPVAEVWFDGACAEGPNGKKQVYAWERYYAEIRRLQPGAVIAVMGPDVRWVGTESGYGRATEWSVVPATAAMLEQIVRSAETDHGAFVPVEPMTQADLGSREQIRDARGLIWYPSEVDVSIRPGWFYHASEDSLVKSPEKLVDIYYASVGRNSVLLLNCPPDKRGLIHESDVRALRGMRDILDGTFAHNLALRKRVHVPPGGTGRPQSLVDGDMRTAWASPESLTTPTIEIALGRECEFDRLLLQENIRKGQRVEAFCLEVHREGGWKEIIRGTTIGYKRLLRFPPVRGKDLRLRILSSRVSPELSEIGIYRSVREAVAFEKME